MALYRLGSATLSSSGIVVSPAMISWLSLSRDIARVEDESVADP
eukprot:CAMPEP_0198304258 /NCGR_PEP_ID=MMETSP1449-20131203/57309_1 /TAXON_ID=420275 /ORGANISM="Attheya septentrionalis, Strain CCMP2084" /LENGTH=43 /DNA_ID= /DNA_START= /DNA_END= /DNA_ORIENTATION=